MLTINEIIKITKAKTISGVISTQETGKICIDSRIIEKNDIFVTIKGNNTDSIKYVKNIINKASMIITDKTITSPSETPIIKVKNTIKAIIQIGMYNRKKYIKKQLIAITGSVGKTTTKDLLYDILKTQYNIVKTDKNQNNQLGVALTLSKINNKTDIIIIEMGMNHKNEIKKLSYLARPNIAIITNIGSSHIGNLKTKQNIFKAKMEITKGMKKGTLIINQNDEYLKKAKYHNIIRCTKNDTKNITTTDKLSFTYKNLDITFPIPNQNFINNITLDIEVAKIFNIKNYNLIKAINEYKTSENRMEIIKLKNNITIISDCYNASYESLISSLSMLKKTDLLILGDILELGKYTKSIHDKIKKEIEKKEIETISVGTYTKEIKTHFNTNEEIIQELKKRKLSNRTILIKASRKMHLEEIKEYLVKHN